MLTARRGSRIRTNYGTVDGVGTERRAVKPSTNEPRRAGEDASR
jgi:hypothetical protein